MTLPEVAVEQAPASGYKYEVKDRDDDQTTKIEIDTAVVEFVPPIIEPIKISKVRVSPTGSLSINFSKSVLIRKPGSIGRRLQAELDEASIDVSDAISVYIEDDGDDILVDKSIVNVGLVQSSDTSVTL